MGLLDGACILFAWGDGLFVYFDYVTCKVFSKPVIEKSLAILHTFLDRKLLNYEAL